MNAAQEAVSYKQLSVPNDLGQDASVEITGELKALLADVFTLVLTFALSAGDAFETPAWRALLPELVEKEDLAAASSLNGIEFNFARAVGPALGGAVVALAGAGTAFSLNALSFAGVIIAVTRWPRVAIKRATPPESVGGATPAPRSGIFATHLQYGEFSCEPEQRCSLPVHCWRFCPRWHEA
jgi:MFS family permease